MLKRFKDRVAEMLNNDMIRQKEEYDAWIEEQASIAESIDSYPGLEEFHEWQESKAHSFES